MKRIIVIISLLFFCLFYSCDSLDLAPIDYFASGNFWNNTAQVNGNMLSLHNDLRSTYQSVFYLGEARGGTQVVGTTTLGTSSTNPDIKGNTLTKDATGASNWYNYYPCIMKVNYFIEQVENGCTFLLSADRGYFLGQAYGLRAYYYFMLYRTYGGVPVVEKAKVLDGATSAAELYTPRSTPKQTLDFIKSDIEKSDQYFSSDFIVKSNALWSKAATLMLKAEVYLWSAKVLDGDQSPANSDLQTAKDALVQLTGRFSLLEKFGDVFSYTNKEENKEIIFAIRFKDGEAEQGHMHDFVYQGPLFINQVYSKEGKLMGDTLELRNLRGNFFAEYEFELFENYEPDDSRRDITFLDFYLHDGGGNITAKGIVLRKALGIINDVGNRVWVSDIPRFRYAETLLMLAEVENKLGNDPSPYINEVRQRAYGTNYNPAIHAYSNGDFATNELAILHERDKEFVFEGKRWFDVRRLQDISEKPLVFSPVASYGTTRPILDYTTEAYEVLWPVDVNVMVNDPTVEQTPGY